MTTELNREGISYRRLPYLNGLELMRATYVGQCFSRHMHERFAVGVVEDGLGAFVYRGATRVAAPGDIFIIHPGETHTGGGFKNHSCTYRVIYPDASLLRGVMPEPHGAPDFPDAIISDDETAGLIRRLHVILESNAARLEQESFLVHALGRLVRRHARAKVSAARAEREPLAVRRVRSYLEAHYSEKVSLSELTRLTGLSAFRLTHAFSREVGLPPHAYLLQIRVLRAKELIAKGRPIVDAALETGFSHQSHLHKHFKRLLGMTPGQYLQGSKNVQDPTRRND